MLQCVLIGRPPPYVDRLWRVGDVDDLRGCLPSPANVGNGRPQFAAVGQRIEQGLGAFHSSMLIPPSTGAQ